MSSFKFNNNNFESLSQYRVVFTPCYLIFFVFYLFLIDLRYKKVYDPFRYINSNESEQDIQEFIEKEKSLSNFRSKIDFFKQLMSEISLLPLRVPMNLFLIDCSKLNQVKNYYNKKSNFFK